jgi:hypothetical protein
MTRVLDRAGIDLQDFDDHLEHGCHPQEITGISEPEGHREQGLPLRPPAPGPRAPHRQTASARRRELLFLERQRSSHGATASHFCHERPRPERTAPD